MVPRLPPNGTDRYVRKPLGRLASTAHTGRVLLDDITELLNIRLEEPDEDTIGGYIFGILGRRPEVGDNVHIGGYRFTVLRVNGFRVVRVKAVPLEPLTAADPE